MSEVQSFIIGGKRRKSENHFPIVNPYNKKEITKILLASENDIFEAIATAQIGFQKTSQLSSYERAHILSSIVSQLKLRKEEIAKLITAESGKPIKFSRAEVSRAISTFEIASEETKRINGEIILLDITEAGKGKKGYVQHFPIGIVACITPFNFPLNLVAHKIAPAIASGNSFILKPAPQTPLTSLLLGEILLESGLPEETINIVPCSNDVAQILVTDERVAMLSFTGSAKVGWMLKNACGKKKIALELGGNAGVIVDDSADIDVAVSRCILGGFGYSGQVCIKVQRVLIHQNIFETFTEKFLSAVKNVVVGDPMSDEVIVGPMISESEAMRVESWVNEAVEQGAKILAGGKRNGVFFEPTVLTNVHSLMKVCSEEIFGPVITLQSFNEINEAIDEINNSQYGLQTGIFSNNHKNIQLAFQKLNVGGVIVNDYPTFRVDNMPYGGVKNSGFGREGVRYAMEEMMEKKLLVI